MKNIIATILLLISIGGFSQNNPGDYVGLDKNEIYKDKLTPGSNWDTVLTQISEDGYRIQAFNNKSLGYTEVYYYGYAEENLLDIVIGVKIIYPPQQFMKISSRSRIFEDVEYLNDSCYYRDRNMTSIYIIKDIMSKKERENLDPNRFKLNMICIVNKFLFSKIDLTSYYLEDLNFLVRK